MTKSVGGIGKVGPWYLAAPLDFARPEAQQANQVLATAYASRSAARALAESAGVSLLHVNLDQAPIYLMRDILRQAAAEQRLEQLLRNALSDPAIAAYHAQLVALMSAPPRDDRAATCDPNVADATDIEPGKPLRTGAADPPAAGRAEESFADVYNGALRLLSDGRLDEALHALSRAIDLDPTLGVAHYNRGLAHYLKEAGQLSPDPQAELRLAIQDFDRALELGISDALLFRNRGNAYSRKGDVPNALADYARAIALEPSNPLAYLNRAEVYENTLQKERAIADYKAVLGLETDEQWHDRARARLRALGVPTRSRRR